MGGVFSSQFGMAAIFGSVAELPLAHRYSFVSAFYVGAMVLQYSIGWFSDRMDRRLLIALVSVFGTVAAVLGIFVWSSFTVLLCTAFFIWRHVTPILSLLIAHTANFLDHEDRVAASSRRLFISGLGAVSGLLVVGSMMDRFGPSGFFKMIVALLG